MNFIKLQKFIDKLVTDMVPGNAVCIYLGGQLVFQYASGYADREAGTPMTGNELLNIYSCSKISTVVAALQLYEQGIFLLSDPLYEYIPEYRHMNILVDDEQLIPAQNHITIGDLFTMTAGFDYNLTSINDPLVKKQTNGNMDTLSVIRNLAKKPLSFEPGTKWQYSLCHDVLAGLVCAVTGQSFRDYVQKYIFDPLDMHDSFYHHTPQREARMAAQYCFVPSALECRKDLVETKMNVTTHIGVIERIDLSVGEFVPGPEYDSGGAGILTTVPDYAKLTAALAAEGKGLTGERILSPGTVRLMHTNTLTPKTAVDFNWPQLAGYGYGLGVRTMTDTVQGGSNGSLGEFGWSGAAGATAIIDTYHNLGVFYAHHMRNPREDYYQPRLRNVIYGCLED